MIIDIGNILLEKIETLPFIDKAVTEQLGIEFCKVLISSEDVYFIQTSYNANIREKFAAIGDEWHEDLDAFITKPYESWILEGKVYVAPVEKPEGDYYWNEDDQEWIEIELPT